MKSWLPKLTAITIVVMAIGIQASTASAASLTSMSDNMSRLKVSENSNHEIKFVSPTGIQSGTSDDIILTFSSEFVLAAEAAVNFDFAVGDSGNCTTAAFTEETLALTASATEWGVDVTGDVLTFEPETDDTHAGGLCYRIRAGSNAVSGGTGSASTITNPTDVDDDDTITFSGGFGDTGTISVDIITDDQVVISATVAPSITFSVSDNTIGYGALSASDDRFATGDTLGNSAATVAHTLAAGTNATSGYIMYVMGATLTSGGNTITAPAGPAVSGTGAEQFGLNLAVSGGGTGTADAQYGTSSQYGWGATGSTQDNIAAATGATASNTYSATYVGNIAAETEAGTYGTTLTYTATATY